MQLLDALQLLGTPIAAVLAAWVYREIDRVQRLRDSLQRWQRWYRDDITEIIETLEDQQDSQERLQAQTEAVIGEMRADSD